ncbi:hypothetical protein X777_09184 [Ooceraea biroi]|uniref:Uncharacterized protein n=1 Tax=Ooceraea biroi TaxID=2015173 RepID=A0A026W8A7_OOCBI|nr:hypothetical protein X777_09184 [Ooceraea biroi]
MSANILANLTALSARRVELHDVDDDITRVSPASVSSRPREIRTATFHGGTPITSDQIPVDLSAMLPGTGFHRSRSDLRIDPRGFSSRMMRRSLNRAKID